MAWPPELPQQCMVCGSILVLHDGICSACQQELPWQRSCCRCCGIALAGKAGVCGRCVQQPPAFDRCRALFAYRTPVPELIAEFKYRHDFASGRGLARLLSRHFTSFYQQAALPQSLVPVPLHQRRLRERGFNQSMEICRIVARHNRVAIDRHSCRRRAHRPPQQGLSARQRQKNISGVFSLAEREQLTAIKHVAIIDDVVTTGATVNELARLLRSAGVQMIDVWCLARVND